MANNNPILKYLSPTWLRWRLTNQAQPKSDNAITRATIGDIIAGRENIGSGGSSAWSPAVYGSYITKSVPVYRAIMARANAMKAAPLVVHRRLSDDKSEPVGRNHPAQALINHVNSGWTFADLVVATEVNLSLWGSAFWLINRDRIGGRVNSLFSLRPDRVSVVPGKAREGEIFDPENYIAGFQWDAGTKKIPLAPDEVVWFRYFNPNDEFGGLSPIAAARQSIDMGINATTFNSKFFENSTIPMDMVFQTTHHMTDEQVDEFYDRLERRMKGASNSHKPMVWDGTQGDIKKLGMSHRDMEFLASLQWTVEDAGRVYGVPMPLMMSQQASTFNNMSEARQYFYTGTIDPEWMFFEAELDEFLLPNILPSRESGELFVKFDRSEIIPLQVAMSASDDRYIKEVRAGTLTINEMRALKGRDPVAWGDAFWIPSSLVPVTDAETVVSATDDGSEGRGYKIFSDDALDVVSRSFATRQNTGVRTFKTMQNKLFEKQHRETLRRVAALAPSSIFESIKSVTEIPNIVTRQGGVFNETEWFEQYKKEGGRLIASMLIREMEAHAEEFGLGAMNADDPDISRWWKDRTDFWARRVNETTAKQIVAEMEAAFINEESVPEIQKRVNRVFDFAETYRSERIARTEMLGAGNQGHLEAYKQSTVVDEKMWLSTLDSRTRADFPPGYNHIDAHRQTVPVESKFVVSGEILDAPGVGGSAGNVINCRCTVAPIVKLKKGYRAIPAKQNEQLALSPADMDKATSWLHENGVTNGHRNGG